MAYNPLRLRICQDGACRDKYGREFDHDSREFKRRRKRTVTPAYHAMMRTVTVFDTQNNDRV